MFIIKIFILTTVSFLVAFVITPFITNILYKYKLGKQIRDEDSAPIFFSLHKKKEGTPTMGGIIIWLTMIVVILTCYLAFIIFSD